ncbi:amidohydrolase family protein [Parasphingorhabdus sp.]|uniref:amidohydrolase family protein n=1 Tax=Parasphingorhabdus sp. TaxID=2709688 RepID=UPI003A952136
MIHRSGTKLTSHIGLPFLAILLAGCQTMQNDASQPLFDTHAHFFSDDTGRYPINSKGAKEGAEALRQRIISHPSTPENILALWDASAVTGGAGVQYSSAYKTDNSYLLDSSDAYPDRISAVVILDATAPETPAKLRDMVTRHGVTGLRLTGFAAEDGSYPWLNSETALATWAEANRLGIAVELMPLPARTATTALGHIKHLARSFPNVKIIVDHIGWPDLKGAPDYGISEAHRALQPLDNVYFKLTTINLNNLDREGLSSSQFVRHVIDIFGADRVMWGSDYGNTQGEFVDMVHRARTATELLNAVERRKVLHDTGKAILGRK